MKYSVGDIVFVKHTDKTLLAAEGKFAEVIKQLHNQAEPCYLLKFKEHVGGHDGQGLTENGYCWALPERCLAAEGELLENSALDHALHTGWRQTMTTARQSGGTLTLDDMRKAMEEARKVWDEPLSMDRGFGFNTLTYRGVPIIYNSSRVRFKRYQSLQTEGGNMLQRLSAQLRKLVKGDEDLKALVELGVYDEELEVQNHGLLLDMLAVVFKEQLGEEARKRLEERKAEDK